MKKLFFSTFMITNLGSVLSAQLSLFNPTIPSAAGTLTGGSFSSITTVGETAVGSQNQSSLSSNVGFGAVDFYPPSAICQNLEIELPDGMASITPEQIGGSSSDNFGIAQLQLSKANFTISDLGENIVTLTVTDFTGFTTQCTATVTVTQMPSHQDLWLIQ